MPKVTEEHRKARRLEISQAALRCFARKGFQATSMAEIIAESGLSAGAIYGNFKNKEELIGEAVREVTAFHAGRVAAPREDGTLPPPREVVERFVGVLGEHFTDFGLLVQIWAEVVTDSSFQHTASTVAAGLRGVFEGYADTWLRRPGARVEGDIGVLARRYGAVMLGVCQGFIVQSALFRDFDAENYLLGLEILQLP
ncbi:TetR/AcrR family transcriptional regulator [Arthrobacter sp.]|uniref:TetR/AcrR family transcriptional regulator n=1 Tax=Arthrobacter sp. TaxID=1667 RepID=UPI003A95C447